MLIHSDNTAADVLMKLGGGHQAIDTWLAHTGVDTIYFRTDLCSWLREQAVKTLFYKEAQKAIIANKNISWGFKTLSYIASWFAQPTSIDFSDETTNVATPRALNQFLVHCYEGKAPGLHNEKHKKLLLLGFMRSCKTGPNSIPKYLSFNTAVMHKTGSGIVGICNDVGIVESLDKAPIAMSIFVKDSIKPMPELEEVIAQVAKAVYDSL